MRIIVLFIAVLVIGLQACTMQDSVEYKARHILVKTKPEAQALIDKLRQGADFAQLAMEYSTGPSAPRGGDLGWFHASSMVKPFALVVQALEPGSFSPYPVKTRFGWHVILLEEIRDTSG